MSSPPFPSVAIIADAHFHDLYGDYDFAGVDVGGQRITARRLTDTVRSTRVFNESYFALRSALDEIVKRRIKHVVLLGDYSDDGQVSTLSGLRRLLDGYTEAHGLIFTATPGNHDIFGPGGRHHAKRLLNPDGTYTILASDSAFIDEDADGMVVTDKMFCAGYPTGLQALPDLGFFRRASDIHWETPFGQDDAPERRLYSVCSADGANKYQMMDASYLVEPLPGLWLLMIDANVFEPRDGDFERGSSAAFIDSTNAGWNAMLQHKQFVFEWMRDVTTRAELEGKKLLTFSHYPMLDILDGTHEDEKRVIGNTSAVKRMPLPDVAAAVMDTGIKVHFSGHLHVNDTARSEQGTSWLVNIGVPSLVAFPPAFKIVTFEEQSLNVETLGIEGQAIEPILNALYRTEISLTGKKVGNMLEAADYGAFICEHVDQLVVHRYLRREWPKDMARIIPLLNLGDLLILSLFDQPVDIDATIILVHAERGRGETKARMETLLAGNHIDIDAFDRITVQELLGDWYRLRMGSEMALDRIPAARLEIYRILIKVFAVSKAMATGGAAEQFARILRMMDCYLSGLPSRNFRINLATGKIDNIG